MASDKIVTITEANFQSEVVDAGMPVLVDFWAPWCGPCRALAPTLDKVAETFAGRVKVGKINIDEHGALASRFGVMSIPQLFVFKGSDQPLQKVVGLVSEAAVTSMLNKHI